jgi:hypothetical protein
MAKKDKGKLAPFIALDRELYGCAAWRALPYGARQRYLTFRARFFSNLHNNGKIFCSHRDARKEMGRASFQSLIEWDEMLVYYGVIVQTAAGALGVDGKGKSPHYRLTELPVRGADGQLVPATKDYMRWNGIPFKPPKKSRKRIGAFQKVLTPKGAPVAKISGVSPPKKCL